MSAPLDDFLFGYRYTLTPLCVDDSMPKRGEVHAKEQVILKRATDSLANGGHDATNP